MGEPLRAVRCAGCVKLIEANQVFVVVAAFRDEDVADPDWFADLVKVARQVEDVLVGAAGQLSVRLVVNQFDIEQQKVSVFHQLVKFTEIWLLSCERISTGIQRCVNAVLFCLAEQLDQEVDLQQRFSAAYGNAAFFSPVVFIAERFFSTSSAVCQSASFVVQVSGLWQNWQRMLQPFTKIT